MTIHDDAQPGDDGVYASTTGRRLSRRRTRAAVGAAGLAAVLGVGAYLVTSMIDNDEPTVAQQKGAVEPVVVASSPATEPKVSASAAAPASAAAASMSPELRKKVDAAREKLAEQGDGVEIQHPAAPRTTANANDVNVTTQGSLKEGGIVRMITAREDLTGQRELAWVAGGVALHRDVPCSQTFQFSTNPAAMKPNLLICWRTSTEKSVVAIVVDPKGQPSRDKAVDALEEKWRTMG